MKKILVKSCGKSGTWHCPFLEQAGSTDYHCLHTKGTRYFFKDISIIHPDCPLENELESFVGLSDGSISTDKKVCDEYFYKERLEKAEALNEQLYFDSKISIERAERLQTQLNLANELSLNHAEAVKERDNLIFKLQEKLNECE